MCIDIAIKNSFGRQSRALRDLFIVCQTVDYCQLLIFIFLTLRTGSVMQFNLSEKPYWYFGRNSFINTCLLIGISFKYFSNNTHMIIVLLEVSVTFMPKACVGLACLLEICLLLHKNCNNYNNIRQKKHLHFVLELFKECITVGSITCSKFFISLNTSSTLTHEN